MTPDIEAEFERTEQRDVTPAMLDYMVRWEAWTPARPRHENASLHCYLAWELEACLSNDLEDNTGLGDFLTVTGTSTDAYATTCKAWIGQEWGETGLSVLEATCEALAHGSFYSDHLSITPRTYGPMSDKFSVCVRIGFPDIGEIVIALQTMAWLAVTFRTPTREKLSCSSAVAKLVDKDIYVELRPLIAAESDLTSSCWHTLLGNSIVACGFSTTRTGGVLELPFPLMLELTGMIYGTDRSRPFRITSTEQASLESEVTHPRVDADTKAHEDGSGVFFSGVHSVLFPTQYKTRSNIVKWHYAASDTVMIPPKEGTWLQLHRSDLADTRTVIGYTPEVHVLLATAERSSQYQQMRSSSAEAERDRWHFTLDGATPQLGFSGSGVSFPFKLIRRKGQNAAPSALPTYDQITSQTVDSPIVLFDTTPTHEAAWLVSQLSVILDLVLFQVHREGGRDGKNIDDKTRQSLHAIPHWNGGLAAQAVLDDHGRANTVLKLSADDGKPLAIKHLVIDIFTAMNVRSQVDQQHPSCSTLSTPPLLGWDLVQLTNAIGTAKRLQFDVRRSVSGSHSVPTWLPLTRELPVYFCDGLGDIMRSAVPLCSEVQYSRKHLFANVQVLNTKLKRCARCPEYHVDIKDQLVWKDSPVDNLVPCEHGQHVHAQARAKFDNDIQLLVPADHKHVASEAIPCPLLPREGAFVFGAKRLRAKVRSQLSA